VATSQPLASAAGVGVLAKGGHAVEAAVAAAAALAVTEPCSTGIGGDCFALVFEADTGRVNAINGSGRSSRALSVERAHADGFDPPCTRFHAHAVTVPGAVAAWCELLGRYGRLDRAQVLLPAIALASEGFPVAPLTAAAWAQGIRGQLDRSPSGAELLIDGRAPRPGERFRNPGMARALTAIAERGAEGLYTGPVARAIVRSVQAAGGVLAEADLADHRSEWVEPISTRYGDARVWECPPNGQGLVALLALNLLRRADIGGLPAHAPERIHLEIEALRLAFADARRHVGDPAHARIPLDVLLGDAYTESRWREVSLGRAHPRPASGALPAGPDTVYLCALDAEGNACSLINSNYDGFGTGLVAEGFGFTLQNRGAAFVLDPLHANALMPGKRPYHTIIPGMLTREPSGALLGPFGVMGGDMQPQGHVQVVTRMLDCGLDPQSALESARFYLEDGSPAGAVKLEPEIPSACVAALLARGHRVVVAERSERHLFGRGQVIQREPDGVYWAGSDPRADGCATTL
jgi:gamma-glutamyltranspeptidase/glutathione hydrolase